MSPTRALFDRLTAPDPQGLAVRPYDLNEQAAAVEHELAHLLNTPRAESQFPDEFPLVRRSVLAYGLPDVISGAMSNPDEQGRIACLIKEAVQHFEPRLDDVQVEPDTDGPGGARVRFRIRARLRDTDLPLTYETLLELGSGHCRVRRTDEAP